MIGIRSWMQRFGTCPVSKCSRTHYLPYTSLYPQYQWYWCYVAVTHQWPYTSCSGPKLELNWISVNCTCIAMGLVSEIFTVYKYQSTSSFPAIVFIQRSPFGQVLWTFDSWASREQSCPCSCPHGRVTEIQTFSFHAICEFRRQAAPGDRGLPQNDTAAFQPVSLWWVWSPKCILLFCGFIRHLPHSSSSLHLFILLLHAKHITWSFLEWWFDRSGEGLAPGIAWQWLRYNETIPWPVQGARHGLKGGAWHVLIAAENQGDAGIA